MNRPLTMAAEPSSVSESMGTGVLVTSVLGNAPCIPRYTGCYEEEFKYFLLFHYLSIILVMLLTFY